MDTNLDSAAQSLVDAARQRACFKADPPLFAAAFAFARAVCESDAAAYLRDPPGADDEAEARRVHAALLRTPSALLSVDGFLDANGNPSPSGAQRYLERHCYPLVFTDAGKHFIVVRVGNRLFYIADEVSFVPPQGFFDTTTAQPKE